MSDREDALVFDGIGPLASGQFVRIVRQNAIEKNKTTDDEWIAFYASSRMDGPALEWLEDQSEEIQESWKLMRRALLIRWPPSAERGVTSSAVRPESPQRINIPTPAAAPPPATSPVPPSTIPSPSAVRARVTQPFKGLLRVENPEGTVLGYFSKDLDGDGDGQLTKAKGLAQVVQFTLSRKPFSLKICGDSSRPTGQCLGWTLPSAATGNRGTLTHVTPPPFSNGSWQSTSKNQGPSHVLTWCLSHDGTMIPFKDETPGSRLDLEIGVTTTSGCFVATPDLKELQKEFTGWKSEHAIFVFEAED